MARVNNPSYTDDLSHVDTVQIKQVKDTSEGADEGAQIDATPGASLSASQRVSITLTQGDHVYIVDTSQGNPLAALLRSSGVKQKKRGAKGAQA